jgi:FkbM family methyltransferase
MLAARPRTIDSRNPMTALNARPWWLIRRNALRPSNYRALLEAAFVYEQPVRSVRQYFVGGGIYPHDVGVRTPLGRRDVTVHGSHDVITVHEIFCRRDYRSSPPPQVVVDLGSNIGISALYFLTRTPSTHCVLYEPLPSNVERLTSNLVGFEDRFEVHRAAVAPFSGMTQFVVESTGRYGHLVDGAEPALDTIDVEVCEVNNVLERVLASHNRIDLVKIDIEGLELDTLRAIRPDVLERVDGVAIEWFGAADALPGFRATRVADVVSYARV